MKTTLVKENICIAIQRLPFWVRIPVDVFGFVMNGNKLFYAAVLDVQVNVHCDKFLIIKPNIQGVT